MVRLYLRLYLGLGCVLMAAAITSLIVAEPFVPDKRATEARLELRAVERDGTVLLDWDNNSPVIRASTSAVLDIVDGGIPQRRPVEVRTLRMGGLAYQRRSPDVLLKLLLLKDSQLLAQPSVRLTGSAPVVAK